MDRIEKHKQKHEKTPSFEIWVNSMLTTLDCVDHQQVQACSISVVPENLRKSKAEAYLPKVVSIGPLHRGTSRDLLYMEEIKWRSMRCLLHRSKEEIQKEDDKQELEKNNFIKCSEAILMLDELVRASYNVDDIELNSKDLAQVMLLDGCFLLELLICGSKELNEKLKCQYRRPSPGIEVRNKENVLSDLTLLENQIPFLIVSVLFVKLFPNIFKRKDVDSILKKLILSLLGYKDSISAIPLPFKESKQKKSEKVDTTKKKEAVSNEVKRQEEVSQGSQKEAREKDKLHGFHFIELVHSFVDKEAKILTNTTDNERSVQAIQIDQDVATEANIKLKRCAMMLEAAGVKIINPIEAQSDPQKLSTYVTIFDKLLHILYHKLSWLIRKISREKNHEQKDLTPIDIKFDLKIAFKDGILQIPPLHITETTEAKWRNFIAWELNRFDQENLINSEGEKKINCKFIWYAIFFQNLVCCVHDVQLLRDRNVIKVHEVERKNKGKIPIMSNEELLNFFRKLTEGIPSDMNYTDSSFCKLFQDLNAHTSNVDRATLTCKLVWHYFRCFITWIWLLCRISYRVLRRDYIPTGWTLIAVIAATTGLALTAIQTAYSIISVQSQ